MRFLVVAEPRLPVPPEQLRSLVERSEEWQDRHADRIETFGLFADGGAFAVVDVPDMAAMHRMNLEMPFTPYSEQQIRPFLDGKTGWLQLRKLSELSTVAA